MIHLKNLTAAPPRLQRMLLRLQGYDMAIKCRPGTEMRLADPLSRLNPLPSEGTVDLHKVCLIQFTDTRLDSLKQDTSTDPELSGLRELIYSGWPDKQKQVQVRQGLKTADWSRRCDVKSDLAVTAHVES